MIESTDKYPNFRFPITIISHAVYLYNRFTLCYRDVSDLLLERGIEVSHQTIKDWNIRFGELFYDEIKKRRRKPTRRWHIDEAHIKIRGNTISGGLWILMAQSWTSLYQDGATRKQLRNSFPGCMGSIKILLGLLLIGLDYTGRLYRRSFQKQNTLRESGLITGWRTRTL